MSHSCEDNEALKHAFTLIQSISSSTQRRALRERKKKISYQTLPVFFIFLSSKDDVELNSCAALSALC